MAPKIWGVLLLILGMMGAINLIASLASLGGGISGSTFAPGLSPELKDQMDRMAAELASSMRSRWTFWLNMAGETFVAALSIVAGVLLVIKPKPVGRKLAIARALLVLLLVPVAGYEGMKTIEQQMEMQQNIMRVSAEDAQKKADKANPAASEAERERRRKATEDVMNQMGPLLKGIGFGAVVFTTVVVVIINGLLLLFISKSSVKEYLEGVAAGGDNSIPGYDPSMGLMNGPPGSPNPPPPNQPPPPPEQQIPPV